ncbi:MAG: ATP-binding protein [Desulfopila sp.]
MKGHSGELSSKTTISGKELVPDALIGRVFDSFDSTVLVADIETNEILYANTYLKRICGFDPTGYDCRDLIHQIQGECNSFCVNSRLLGSDGKPAGAVSCQYQNRFDNRWYGVKAQALEWASGRYVRFEIGQDITESRRLRGQLREARQQARNAVETKNRFVALVAHDLKSPIVSILGMLKRILKKEAFRHDIHRKFLESIIVNGQRMMKMIDNLLGMDRLQTGRIKPEPSLFDLAEMINEVFDSFTHLAQRKRLSLVNQIPAATGIYADPELFKVVLNNLLSNAVKFSYAGGRITVSYEANSSHTRLIVRDGGCGMPQDYLKDIFRADVKTTLPGTGGEIGSGFGLVFCQQIMEAHGGSISLESVEGAGSTFYVELCSCCELPESVPLPPFVCRSSER